MTTAVTRVLPFERWPPCNNDRLRRVLVSHCVAPGFPGASDNSSDTILFSTSDDACQRIPRRNKRVSDRTSEPAMSKSSNWEEFDIDRDCSATVTPDVPSKAIRRHLPIMSRCSVHHERPSLVYGRDRK